MAQTTQTFEAAAYTADGTRRDPVTLPPALFDGTVHMPVMHQAVKAYLANQRQGTASTKTRRWVTGGNQKPWRQKGTGRARQGSIRAPHWVGGGTVFGPTPRSYTQRIPSRVRALARKSAFNARAREGAVILIDPITFEAPKTARLMELLGRLGVTGQKVLLLTNGVNRNVYLSGRNIPWVHVMPYRDASTYHILWSDVVVIESTALDHGGSVAEGAEVAESGGPEAAPGAAGEGDGAGELGSKGAKRAARKAASKKSSTARKSASSGRAAAEKAAKKAAAKEGARAKTAGRTAAKKTGKKKGS